MPNHIYSLTCRNLIFERKYGKSPTETTETIMWYPEIVFELLVWTNMSQVGAIFRSKSSFTWQHSESQSQWLWHYNAYITKMFFVKGMFVSDSPNIFSRRTSHACHPNKSLFRDQEDMKFWFFYEKLVKKNMFKKQLKSFHGWAVQQKIHHSCTCLNALEDMRIMYIPLTTIAPTDHSYMWNL